ncbi:hypothetical protein SAMN04488561_3692 [Jiangella alba]|uniref:Uncharacterized protein n=2 Tax=Jiangella alba TaxID=561176 RepID=A0A1H5P4D4_9ACTN|nr:hypothetical protein SAMN04488561_3692 [Jiangella alba]
MAGMSRDVFVQDVPPAVRSVAEIPDSWRPAPLPFGHAEVVAAVRELVPSADFTDPTWGHVLVGGADIEVNVADRPQLDSFALHIRGADDDANRFVAQLLQRLGVRAFDVASETGIFTGG